MQRNTTVAGFLLIIITVFTACGELDSLFSPGRSYQIKVMVNDSPLDDCSILRSDDIIRPHFTVPVKNDPDLTGLLAFMQNSRGEIVGETVLYALESWYYHILSQNEQNNTQEPEDEADNAVGRDQGNTAVRDNWGFINSRPATVQYDVLVKVESLEQIPHFPIPEEMEIGSYNLVFEARGKNEILHRTEAVFYYIGNAVFSLRDISIFLPGTSEGLLIPPGITILLEPNLDFDSRLDPYVIWYNGKNIISEGALIKGAGSMLWEAPERTGFYSLRVELFPFHLRGNVAGISREITLPVSSKAAANNGYFYTDSPEYAALNPLALGTLFPEQLALHAASAEDASDKSEHKIPPVQPALLRWYQFKGNLIDTMTEPEDEPSIMSVSENKPFWAGMGHSYGLSTGSDDIYILSPVSFLHDANDQGGGIFLLHIRSLAEGPVFSVHFPYIASVTEGVQMDIFRRSSSIILRLKTKETFVEMPVSLPPFDSQPLIPVTVEFYIHPARFEAKLSLGERHSIQSVTGSIRLSGIPEGEGIITLGGRPEKPETVDILDTEITEEDIEPVISLANAGSTIWDEFAILYSSLPILEEGSPEDDTEEPQTPEIANENNLLQGPEAEEIPLEETAGTNLSSETDDPEEIG
ncbi:MAG: hypothetical protein FWG89_03775 [Treponema sp.]|nr:hypothetical protein [Treponema sp.]